MPCSPPELQRRGGGCRTASAILRSSRRRSAAFVVAPHPFFPAGSCLGVMDGSGAPASSDAVERNAMFTRSLDSISRPKRWADAHGKPMVGNGDVHRLYQLGTCYSLVDAPLDPDAICDAIRDGRVTVHARPLSPARAARTIADLTAARLRPRSRRARLLQPLTTGARG